MRWLPFRRASLRQDGIAGIVLGVQSVPDSLATGLLAGVNPLYGLNAYILGTLGGALTTSSAFMAVQATGAMALIVSDVPEVHEGLNQSRALFTLTVLTGLVMVLAALLRLGTVLRFVSNAVMVGFLSAVGVNIVLGQLAGLTGFSADGPNRVFRAIATLLNPLQWDVPTLAIGLVTTALIIALERTRIGALGLVVAVIITSAAVQLLDLSSVATLNDLGIDVGSLPMPSLPLLELVPVLLIPAFSLAFVGLVQGAGISASTPNPDGKYPNPSRDFAGQGMANLASGLFQGMPVGGSVSATALNRAAGARSRQSLVFTAAVMVIVVIAFGEVVGYMAMPALAGLLILIGVRTVKPAQLGSVWHTGGFQRTILVVTFAMTLLVPLQYAVLVGVALSILLHVIHQSNRLTLKAQAYDDDGHLVESDPPPMVSVDEVLIIQPYGSLFFASAAGLEKALPKITAASGNSVVIIRLRGREELGSTVSRVLLRYAESLHEVGSRLVLVSVNERVEDQLTAAGVTRVVGEAGIYRGDERAGATLRRAVADAHSWIAESLSP